MAYDLLVGTLQSKRLHFWKFMGIGEFFILVSFIVDAVIERRALTCPVTCLFKIWNAGTAIRYPKYMLYFVSDQHIVLFCSCIMSYVHELKREFTTSCLRTSVMLYVVLWVESHVIITLQYGTGMTYIFCDNPRYVVLGVFHVTAVGAARAAIPFCHEMVSTGFGFDISKLILGLQLRL